jgi:hypothetical protein
LTSGLPFIIPDLDTQKSDFWGIHQIVIASLPTLRADHKGRHERLLDAPQWDMLIVDEAHHLNAEEGATKTLGFDLVEKLQAAGKTPSCVLFQWNASPGKGLRLLVTHEPAGSPGIRTKEKRRRHAGSLAEVPNSEREAKGN